jgi:predicted nucleotidyltransferase
MKRLHPRINAIVDALRVYAPESIHLFGSWARGEADELSDVDLVVIKNTKLPFFERLAEAARLLPPEAGGVDLLIYTAEEFQTMLQEGNAFVEMIAEEGILVYGRRPQN